MNDAQNYEQRFAAFAGLQDNYNALLECCDHDHVAAFNEVTELLVGDLEDLNKIRMCRFIMATAARLAADDTDLGPLAAVLQDIAEILNDDVLSSAQIKSKIGSVMMQAGRETVGGEMASATPPRQQTPTHTNPNVFNSTPVRQSPRLNMPSLVPVIPRGSTTGAGSIPGTPSPRPFLGRLGYSANSSPLKFNPMKEALPVTPTGSKRKVDDPTVTPSGKDLAAKTSSGSPNALLAQLSKRYSHDIETIRAPREEATASALNFRDQDDQPKEKKSRRKRR